MLRRSLQQGNRQATRGVSSCYDNSNVWWTAHRRERRDNHYFPPASVKHEFLREHDRTSVCSWKGTANYYTVTVDGESVDAAGWYYAEPMTKAANIVNYVAFYPVVTVAA